MALAPNITLPRIEQAPPDPNVAGVSTRLRPEVPSFDFTSRRVNESGPCSRCGSIAELRHAYCPQCGASLTSANSPIADAARNSIPPHAIERNMSVAATRAKAADPMDTNSSAAKCPQCGVSVIDSANDCPQCGYQMPEMPETNAPPPEPENKQLAADHVRPGDVATVRPPISNSQVGQSQAPGRPQVLTEQLVMLAQDGTAQRIIQLAGERVDLGRTEGEIVLSEDVYLSARHARFEGREGVRTLVDLGSLNGIFLRIRGSVALFDGTTFLIGLQLLKFDLEMPETTNLAPIRVAGCSLFGSSTSPRYARLSERTSDGAPRSVFVVGRDETILGREVGDIVFSGDPFMSRRHAALTRDPADGTFTLRDLGSSNGTFLRVHGKVDLESGDHLRIGQHLFRYEMDNP